MKIRYEEIATIFRGLEFTIVLANDIRLELLEAEHIDKTDVAMICKRLQHLVNALEYIKETCEDVFLKKGYPKKGGESND